METLGVLRCFKINKKTGKAKELSDKNVIFTLDFITPSYMMIYGGKNKRILREIWKMGLHDKEFEYVYVCYCLDEESYCVNEGKFIQALEEKKKNNEPIPFLKVKRLRQGKVMLVPLTPENKDAHACWCEIFNTTTNSYYEKKGDDEIYLDEAFFGV